MQISPGSRVTLHFSLKLADGMLVESSFDDEPVTFVLGDGSLDHGLELALYGLSPGDRQTLTLMPGQAFGVRDEAAVRLIPRTSFPADMQPEAGQIIGFSGEDGEPVAGAVLEVGPEQVKMDFNHPLAGREILFEVQVLSVQNPAGERD
jgi:FKBP-type peptidyl-prolyl cis-trans isomerase SlpA